MNDGYARAVEERMHQLEAECERLRALMDALTQEIAKYLSPINENARKGYWVAAVRDLAQIMISAQGNASDAEAKLAKLEGRLREDGSTTASAAADRDR